MKKYITFLFIAFFISLNAQTIKLNYTYFVKNTSFQNLIEFNSNSYINLKNKDKLYTVDFGLGGKNLQSSSSNSLISNDTYQYQFFQKNNSDITYSLDKIENTQYLFEDKIEKIQWEITDEFKTFEQKKLRKATAYFRGRTYIAWYDETASFSFTPWKLSGLKGLVYEMYDDQNLFKWVLKSFEKINDADTISNPFEKSTLEKISYTKYPKIRYGLSPELEAALRQNPNNKIFEQERNGLEIKFEWEK